MKRSLNASAYFFFAVLPLMAMFAGATLLAPATALADDEPGAPTIEGPGPPPNVIVIFCDDLGYSDIGCFGSTHHRTPNIDQMAAEGRKLTSFYVTCGVCSPSRSSLMTGCYPRRISLHEGGPGEWVIRPQSAYGINADEYTMGELFHDAGYATAIVGKWHLGDQPAFLPTRHGFDSYFGIPFSNDMGYGYNRNYTPLPLLRNEEVIEEEPDQRQLTARYTQEAINFISANHERPFFLYLPHSMPHNPAAASENFAGQSANGRFGDSVEEIDWSTGQILATLKEHNIDENTFVIFTSDNGASRRWQGCNLPLSGFKGTALEGGMRVCCVVRWPGQIPAGTECNEMMTTMDLLPTFAGMIPAELPTERKIDGLDVYPLLVGEEGATTPREYFAYYFRDQLQAIRSGPWKMHLVDMAIRNRHSSRVDPRLFNLEEDIAEENNVAADHPEIVAQLLEYAEEARETLGDRGRDGTEQRPSGHVENPQTLTPRRTAE